MSTSLLAGRIALITGAGSGIGKATAQVLARQGVNVVAVDLNGDHAKQTANELKKLEGGSKLDHLSFAADVSKKDQVEHVFNELLKHFKTPATVLVNSAGITRDAQIADMTEELFDQVMNVNLKGTFLPIQVSVFKNRNSKD